MIRSIRNYVNGIRLQLEDMRYALEYPSMNLPNPPRDCDVRGEYEMDLYWRYQEKLIEKRDGILCASNDPENAGYSPESLENPLWLYND